MISVMFSLAGAVLVIVCLNISGMMLVRGASRERELSIRAALGAGRRRLIQHLFFEAFLLAFTGGALSAFVLFGIPALAGWWIGRAGSSRDRFRRRRYRDLVRTVPAGERALRIDAAVRFSRPNLVPALKDDAGGGGRQAIRVHRVAAMVQVGIAIPFLVRQRRDARPGADGRFWLSNRWTGGRAPAGASRTRARGWLLHPEGSRQSSAGKRRARCCAWPRACRSTSTTRHFRVARTGGAEFVTAHVTRVGENFLETIGAPLAARPNDHGRGPPHGCAGRRDFRTARGATVSRRRADWRTGDGHAGREPRRGVHDCRRECGLRHLTADHRATADPAAAARLVRRSLAAALAGGALPKTVHLIARGAPGDEPTVEGGPGEVRFAS